MAADFRIHNLIAEGASFSQRPTINSSGVALVGDLPVYTTGNQTINGVKTFNSKIIVEDVSIGKGAGGIATNTVLGNFALINNIDGYQNSSLGYAALQFNTSGYRNTANGPYSLNSNTLGNGNSAFGPYSLYTNKSGNYNIAIGYQSLYFNEEGNRNTANGYQSLYGNKSGLNNVGIGYNAGSYVSAGAFNTYSYNSVYIGPDSKPDADNQINQIVIGASAIGIGSNTTTIGNSSITETKLAGAITTYNTYTSSTNYERLSLKYNGSDAYQIGTDQGTAGGLPRSLEFITSGVSRMQINSGGNISATALILTSGLAITGIAPATTGSDGVSGQMVFASNFIYRHNGTNWQRTGISFANW